MSTKKIWVETHLIDPPPNETVSARFGNSYMFAGYEPLLNQWYWLQPKGVVEKIPEPEAIFVTEAWAREHPATRKRRENGHYIRRRREEQLLLI